MVLSSINPAPQSYHLWRRFRMPRINRTSDAVAVEAKVGHELNSAYTFLLEHIVLLVWSLFIFSGVLLALKVYKERHPEHPITKMLWTKKTSPFDILKLTTKHLFNKKSEYRSFLIFLWAILSLGFLVAKYTVPIIFARYIIIDNAAPVNSQAMYYPTYAWSKTNPTNSNPQTVLEVWALELPSAIRAVGNVDTLIKTNPANPQVSLENLEPDPTSNDPNQRINYNYEVTGLDFGLQHYPDLILNVEGSCSTDYSWLNGTSLLLSTDPTVIADTYTVFPNTSESFSYAVTTNNGPNPSALFSIGQASAPASNWTWSAIVSSVNRSSFWPGNDPWYLTVQAPGSLSPGKAGFSVKPGRPALSCWQNDVWSYHGHESSVAELTPSSLPGLNLSLAMQDIFSHFLGLPKIPVLAQRLGISALKSASTYQGGVFNASSSSLFGDLQRLVFASYIATVNTLTETTLFANGSKIQNDLYAISGSNSIPAGVDEFVIWSTDVITLSVKALIIIPVLSVTLWIIAITVLLLRLPEIEELKVAVKATLADGKEQAVETIKNDLGDTLGGN